MIDTLCKETILYFPTNLRGDYFLEKDLGEACGGLRRLLPEEAWGSPRRAAETTPGEGWRVWEEVHHILSQDNCGESQQ